MNETRVNLKHLLEDIRDSYTSPLEEVILTELVANALDSKAVNIHFDINEREKFIRCVDDGNGMKRAALKDYHNIASSSKTRGQGIGFAGVGAKLSLLIADKVVTESKGGYGSQCATEWKLSNTYRAPWKFVPFLGSVSGSRGTSVAIYFSDGQPHLLKSEFVERAIIKHFYPLLSENFYKEFLRYFYKKPVNFFVNGRQIVLPEDGQQALQHRFKITLGKSRNPAGVGFLIKSGSEPSWLEKILGKEAAVSSLSSGLWISTFGKVIKGGWEWLGILPKNAGHLSGLVEIPALSEILTTNKNDFLSDANSLKKYYKYRKAVQEAVLPVLQQLGESPVQSQVAPEKLIKPLNQSITSALNQLVDDFPELESLIGQRRAEVLGKAKKEEVKPNGAVLPATQEDLERQSEVVDETKDRHQPIQNAPSAGIANASKSKTVKARTSGLKLALGEISDDPSCPLGRVVEDTLTVNTAHPAWQKAKQKGQEEYHVIITVASVLSRFLENEKSPQDFLNRLLLAWANEADKSKPGQLF